MIHKRNHQVNTGGKGWASLKDLISVCRFCRASDESVQDFLEDLSHDKFDGQKSWWWEGAWQVEQHSLGGLQVEIGVTIKIKSLFFVLFCFSFYSAWRERLLPILADVCVALKAFKGVSYVSVH